MASLNPHTTITAHFARLGVIARLDSTEPQGTKLISQLILQNRKSSQNLSRSCLFSPLSRLTMQAPRGIHFYARALARFPARDVTVEQQLSIAPPI